MTDSEYVLDQLDRHPNGRDAMQIISASLRDREVGLTVHSRVADLRAQGYTITCQIEGKTRKGRERYVYRLVSEPESANGGVTSPTLPRAPAATAPAVRVAHTSTAPLCDAGFVEPPAVVAGRGAEIPALPDVNPDQMQLIA